MLQAVQGLVLPPSVSALPAGRGDRGAARLGSGRALARGMELELELEEAFVAAGAFGAGQRRLTALLVLLQVRRGRRGSSRPLRPPASVFSAFGELGRGALPLVSPSAARAASRRVPAERDGGAAPGHRLLLARPPGPALLRCSTLASRPAGGCWWLGHPAGKGGHAGARGPLSPRSSGSEDLPPAGPGRGLLRWLLRGLAQEPSPPTSVAANILLEPRLDSWAFRNGFGSFPSCLSNLVLTSVLSYMLNLSRFMICFSYSYARLFIYFIFLKSDF